MSDIYLCFGDSTGHVVSRSTQVFFDIDLESVAVSCLIVQWLWRDNKYCLSEFKAYDL